MKTRILPVAGLLTFVVVFVAVSLPGPASSAAAESGGITVQGTASVVSVPDRAELSFGVESQGQTARAALSANAAEMRRVHRSRQSRRRHGAEDAVGLALAPVQRAQRSAGVRRHQHGLGHDQGDREGRRSDRRSGERGREPGLRAVALPGRPERALSQRSRRPPSRTRARAHRRSRRPRISRSAASPRSSRAAARRSPCRSPPKRRWTPARRRSSRARSRSARSSRSRSRCRRFRAGCAGSGSQVSPRSPLWRPPRFGLARTVSRPRSRTRQLPSSRAACRA